MPFTIYLIVFPPLQESGTFSFIAKIPMECFTKNYRSS